MRFVLLLLLALALQGCASSGPGPDGIETSTSPTVQQDLQEAPAPEGKWRPHRLSTCTPDVDVATVVERYQGICSEYYRDGSG